MMLFEKLTLDERARANTRYAAAIWLGVTQVLLFAVIFYRLYILGQADDELRDFQAVLAISLFGYMGLQLFLGGVMPVPTWKGMMVSYVVLTGIITVVCLAIYGWPEASQWANTWLPALLGPAILVAAYAAVARMGQWRIEREIQMLGGD
jgi:phosphoglycerol transferase MdoB-like AlkP superfamily enzyme